MVSSTKMYNMVFSFFFFIWCDYEISLISRYNAAVFANFLIYVSSIPYLVLLIPSVLKSI